MGHRPCQAVTKHGTPCQGGAMPGTKFCGSHRNWTPPTPPTPAAACRALTKKGAPCRNTVEHGSDVCGSHRTITTVEAPPTPAAPPVTKRWHNTPPRTFGPFDPRGVHVRYDNGRWWEPQRD